MMWCLKRRPILKGHFCHNDIRFKEEIASDCGNPCAFSLGRDHGRGRFAKGPQSHPAAWGLGPAGDGQRHPRGHGVQIWVEGVVRQTSPDRVGIGRNPVIEPNLSPLDPLGQVRQSTAGIMAVA